MMNSPPINWEDKDAWDCYFDAELSATHRISFDSAPIVLRFLSFAQEKGGRVWFAGCGLDRYPYTYAGRGCNVLATDFSPVAVRYQQRLAADFLKQNKAAHVQGTLTARWLVMCRRMLRQNKAAHVQGTLAVVEHDFTHYKPDGEFDVVINIRAFQGLSASAMRAAAGNFYAALRPGGACIIDTMNVQGPRRNLIEDGLMAAGFYIPFQKSERWYRLQLVSTGIVYWMVLERPHIPNANQYPQAQFTEFAKRDQQILDSFRGEYERRLKDEEAEAKAMVSDPATIVAHVVYATG
jgi:hypothetical protein